VNIDIRKFTKFSIIIAMNYVTSSSFINQQNRTRADLSIGPYRQICQRKLFDQISGTERLIRGPVCQSISKLVDTRPGNSWRSARKFCEYWASQASLNGSIIENKETQSIWSSVRIVVKYKIRAKNRKNLLLRDLHNFFVN